MIQGKGRTRKLLSVWVFAAVSSVMASAAAFAQNNGDAVTAGVFRGSSTAVRFDVSPPLRDMVVLPPRGKSELGGLMIDPSSHINIPAGPQDRDPLVQAFAAIPLIPAPIVSFNAQSNISGVSPPDPVGDVGPNHYVAMSNLSFQIFNKTGTSLFGPAATNTLWAGFGGACQTENAGDPVILYDQLADRWLLTQFTAAGPGFFNCVALSTGPDPTGTYFRYAFSTGSNFPDYPKYGIWPNAYFISTREFGGGPFAGVGAYAVDRAQMLVGNPAPTLVSFLVPPGAAAFNVGDGLLPADLDGIDLPPVGSPNYYVGSMDNGGPYGATQDALTLWKFVADFVTPAASSFTLANTIPIAAYDTIFPCTPAARDCIVQPGTTTKIDILSYRQRPLHRLAYRNFGTHESLVTNQSVEAVTGIAGIRWWEIRSPNALPVIFQEGTFAPGATDGVHRWMASAAMDSAGNIGMAYSASSGTVFPSIRYTGRLSSDALGTMPQGEGEIIAGTGSQTGSQRWGDYSSINLDPTDDCTFWVVNEYVPVTGSNWTLRVGSFRFNECGTPGFSLGASPANQSICTPANASYTVNLNSIASFNSPVALLASGNPAPSTALFTPNPVPTLPNTSTLTIGNTATVAAGSYTIQIDGTSAPATPRMTTVGLNVVTAIPPAPTLTTPANSAINQPLRPTFQWTGSNTESYNLQVASDVGFTTVVFNTTVTGTTATPNVDLPSNSTLFWRVSPTNTCGPGPASTVFSFSTQAAPGDCASGSFANVVFSENLNSSAALPAGWATTGSSGASTWTVSTQRPFGGSGRSLLAVDVITVSDQRLTTVPIAVPSGQNPVTLQFQSDRTIENNGAAACWDGAIVETSIDGGANFVQVPAASMLTDPYSGPVSSGNVLTGLQAWCGTRPYLKSVVDLSSFAGQSVVLRFRLGTDSSVGGTPHGWYVDDVVVQSCSGSPPQQIFGNGFE